jgi:hypothetical protein
MRGATSFNELLSFYPADGGFPFDASKCAGCFRLSAQEEHLLKACEVGGDWRA